MDIVRITQQGQIREHVESVMEPEQNKRQQMIRHVEQYRVMIITIYQDQPPQPERIIVTIAPILQLLDVRDWEIVKTPIRQIVGQQMIL